MSSPSAARRLPLLAIVAALGCTHGADGAAIDYASLATEPADAQDLFLSDTGVRALLYAIRDDGCVVDTREAHVVAAAAGDIGAVMAPHLKGAMTDVDEDAVFVIAQLACVRAAGFDGPARGDSDTLTIAGVGNHDPVTGMWSFAEQTAAVVDGADVQRYVLASDGSAGGSSADYGMVAAGSAPVVVTDALSFPQLAGLGDRDDGAVAVGMAEGAMAVPARLSAGLPDPADFDSPCGYAAFVGGIAVIALVQALGSELALLSIGAGLLIELGLPIPDPSDVVGIALLLGGGAILVGNMFGTTWWMDEDRPHDVEGAICDWIEENVSPALQPAGASVAAGMTGQDV